MYPQRRQRLVRFLDEPDLDALVLRRPSSVGWAAEGARTHIDVSGEVGVAWLVVGDPTGYLSRDHLGTPASAEAVEEAQAFAWNPRVPGLKVKDTVLATATGGEVLTLDPAWPVQEAVSRPRPLVLTT